MKIKKIAIHSLLIIGAALLPVQNQPIDENLIHAALSLSAIVAGAGIFYVIHRDTGKSLLKETHTRSPEVQKQREAVSRYRDFEKKVPSYANALTSLQKKLDAMRVTLEQTTIAAEDKTLLNKWISSTTESLNKIGLGHTYSGETNFDEQFAEIFSLSDSDGNSLIQKYFDTPISVQLTSLPEETDYALVCETQKSVQEVRLPVDVEAVKKKIAGSEQAIEEQLEKKVDTTVKKIEEKYPYIDTLIKTTPQLVITIGGVILNQGNNPTVGGGDK